MLRTVHGLLLAVIVTVLCSGVCGLPSNHEDAVVLTDKLPYNNQDFESLQLVEPLIANENEVEIVPEDYINTILRTFKEKQKHEDFQKDAILGKADDVVKQRITRQATHQFTPLYPQLPSGPPYNPYQPQPNSNLPSQNPYQPQPSPYAPNSNQQQPYNPYTQNPNQQQPYNPYTQNPNQPQPGYNPYTQNPNQPQPSYNPYTPNPNQQPSATYKPPGPNQFPQRPPQWNTNNSSQPGNQNYNPNQGAYNPNSGQNSYNSRPGVTPGSPYRPPNGQYPVNNQTSNFPPNSGGYRPPNATPLAPYTPAPGQSPYNNYPPSSGNIQPAQRFNATSQRPPYYNPSQYPNPAQWPNSTSSQYPNFPGPYNTTRTPQGPASPYYPGPDGKFPSNAYNPSIPNYPPQNYNQGQNNSASYDPRRVPSQNFSYH